MAQEGQGSDEKGYRQEFVSLIQQAKAIYEATHPATETTAPGVTASPAIGPGASKADEAITHAGPVTIAGEPVTSTTPLVAGDAVQVEWGGSWWKATIVDAAPNGNVKIHYNGWEANWDEVAPLARLRK